MYKCLVRGVLYRLVNISRAKMSECRVHAYLISTEEFQHTMGRLR